jgi:hypothetical protein
MQKRKYNLLIDFDVISPYLLVLSDNNSFLLKEVSS